MSMVRVAGMGTAPGERYAGLAASKRAWTAVVVAVALAILGAGCTSDAGDTEVLGSESVTTSVAAPVTTASTTTTTAPTTTESAPPVTAFPEPGDGEVFDAYIAERLKLFRGVVRAAAENPTLTPEVDFPEMALYGAEGLLDVNYEHLRDFAIAGEAVREPAESPVGRTIDDKFRISPVVEIDGDTLTVFECKIDDVDLIDVATEEIKLTGVLTGLVVVTMKRFDDGWKAVDSEVSQTLEGVDGCFLAGESEFPY